VRRHHVPYAQRVVQAQADGVARLVRGQRLDFAEGRAEECCAPFGEGGGRAAAAAAAAGGREEGCGVGGELAAG